MLPIDHLRDAVLAEGVSTLRDVRLVEGLEADYTLGELAHDLVHADLDCLIVS